MQDLSGLNFVSVFWYPVPVLYVNQIGTGTGIEESAIKPGHFQIFELLQFLGKKRYWIRIRNTDLDPHPH
jgi:hypothetical protein